MIVEDRGSCQWIIAHHSDSSNMLKLSLMMINFCFFLLVICARSVEKHCTKRNERLFVSTDQTFNLHLYFCQILFKAEYHQGVLMKREDGELVKEIHSR